MARRNRRPQLPLPVMVAELMLYSWETIARRAAMMAQGRCSPAEYSRMIDEKAAAAYRSGLVLAQSRGPRVATAALSPWHRRAAANARRLRKR